MHASVPLMIHVYISGESSDQGGGRHDRDRDRDRERDRDRDLDRDRDCDPRRL